MTPHIIIDTTPDGNPLEASEFGENIIVSREEIGGGGPWFTFAGPQGKVEFHHTELIKVLAMLNLSPSPSNARSAAIIVRNLSREPAGVGAIHPHSTSAAAANKGA